MRVVIKRSTNAKKKHMAIFYDEDGKKIKTTHFGAAGMSDFTQHRDEARKKRYLARHRVNQNWNDFKSAGSLSRYILWNLPTKTASIQNYKKRFGLK